MRISREAREYASQRTGTKITAGSDVEAFTRDDVAEAFQAGMRFIEQRARSIGKLAGAGKNGGA